MSTIETLNSKLGQQVEGQYLLTHIECNEAYNLLTFEDYTGVIKIYDDLPWFDYDQTTHLNEPVDATLVPFIHNGELTANIIQVYPVPPEGIESAPLLLPFSLRRHLRDEELLPLIMATSWDMVWPLRGFLNRVLMDERIYPAFYISRASNNKHYNRQGGLLAHSVKSMEIANDAAHSAGMSAEERDLTRVIALLQHLGSIRTVQGFNYDLTHPIQSSTAVQTCRLLEPHLAWLRKTNPHYAALLDYAFDYLTCPAKYRELSRFVGIELAVTASITSAALEQASRLETTEA